MSATQTIIKNDLPQYAATLLAELKQEIGERAVVLALVGDLGAGKTTLVQAIARALGITETVTSPTFTIMKHYETNDADFRDLVHMDAYRIESLDELGPLRFEELLATPHLLLCVEWAEKIKGALPPSILTVALTPVDEETRTVQVTRS